MLVNVFFRNSIPDAVVFFLDETIGYGWMNSTLLFKGISINMSFALKTGRLIFSFVPVFIFRPQWDEVVNICRFWGSFHDKGDCGNESNINIGQGQCLIRFNCRSWTTFKGWPVVCTWMAVRYSASERWRNSHSTSSFAFSSGTISLDIQDKRLFLGQWGLVAFLGIFRTRCLFSYN